MTMTVELFRQQFRAFNDPDLSEDGAVNYYIGLATNFLTGGSQGSRWDSITLDRAVGLYVAHHLVLDARDAQAVSGGGGIPGELEGVATGKTVDKVSITQDAELVSFENEPFWNQTRYGVALMELVRLFGAGGVQIGVPTAQDLDTFGILHG